MGSRASSGTGPAQWNPNVRAPIEVTPGLIQEGDFGATGMGAAQAFAGLSAITATAGLVMSTIGAYYAADAAQHRLEMQESAFKFQAMIADMNARRGEEQASAVLRDAQHAIELTGLRAGQEASAIRVNAAARGVSIGVGSSAEVEASRRVIAAIDKRTISRNAVRQSHAVKRGATNQRIRGMMLRASAVGAGESAGSISTVMAGVTAGMSGVARVGPMWADYARRY